MCRKTAQVSYLLCIENIKLVRGAAV